MIEAIQTRYAGYHFRSRLEARWAVFFDALGIRWEYEKEGVVVRSQFGDRTWQWLPDFYLPSIKAHVEVKGDWEGVSLDYWQMILESLDWNGPFATGECGVMLLGSIPNPSTKGVPLFPYLEWDKGVFLYGAFFDKAPREQRGSILGAGHGSDLEYFDSSCGCTIDFRDRILPGLIDPLDLDVEFSCDYALSRGVSKAFTAARSARFEHGETPRR